MNKNLPNVEEALAVELVHALIAQMKISQDKNQEMNQKIKALDDSIATLEQEIRAIEPKSSKSFITNCSFSYDPEGVDPEGGNSIDLDLVRDVKTLVHIRAFLIEREGNFKKAAKDLGVEDEFKWAGHLKNDWLTDIETRLAQIQISQKKQDLERLKQQLNSIRSPEIVVRIPR